MGDQLTIDTGEIDTLPGLMPKHNSDHEKSPAKPATRRNKGFFASLRPIMQAYGAALVASYVIVPSIATIFTVVFYLATSNVPGWQLVASGFIVTGIVWLALSIPLSALTSAQAANPHNYGQIENRLSRLETRFFVIHNTIIEDKFIEDKLKQYQHVALEEAHENLSKLHDLMYRSTSRLPWVLAMGYVSAWNWIHRTEEALIEIEPIEMVVSGAYHDYMAISDSKMDNSKYLLNNLTDATKKLDPKFANVFAASSPSSVEAETLGEIEQGVNNIEQSVHMIATKLGVQLSDSVDQSAKTAKDSPSTPDKEANARVTLHEIRRALNEFRDKQRLGIVSIRNQLMATIFLTGFVTYALLCTTILAVVPTNNFARATILAAVVFYIVGAMAGLFGRIYSQSRANTGGDDYGLSLVRLISTPLISGLAGIGGAFLYNILNLQGASGSSGLTVSPVTLSSIFTLNRLDYLIAAAIFGFAPNLLMRGLQASKYVSALQSSETSKSTDTSSQQSETS